MDLLYFIKLGFSHSFKKFRNRDSIFEILLHDDWGSLWELEIWASVQMGIR